MTNSDNGDTRENVERPFAPSPVGFAVLAVLVVFAVFAVFAVRLSEFVTFALR